MSHTTIDQNQNVVRAVPILISFLIAGFIGLFSETALNMALGNLMQEFDVVSSTVQWITTGYLLTMGILIPVTALLIQWLMANDTPTVYHICLIFNRRCRFIWHGSNL